jgi:hypothetical protein
MVKFLRSINTTSEAKNLCEFTRDLFQEFFGIKTFKLVIKSLDSSGIRLIFSSSLKKGESLEENILSANGEANQKLELVRECKGNPSLFIL